MMARLLIGTMLFLSLVATPLTAQTSADEAALALEETRVKELEKLKAETDFLEKRRIELEKKRDETKAINKLDREIRLLKNPEPGEFEPKSSRTIFDRFFVFTGYTSSAALQFVDGTITDAITKKRYRQLDGTGSQSKFTLSFTFRRWTIYRLVELKTGSVSGRKKFWGTSATRLRHIDNEPERLSDEKVLTEAELEKKNEAKDDTTKSVESMLDNWHSDLHLSWFNFELKLSINLALSSDEDDSAPTGLAAQNGTSLELLLKPVALDIVFLNDKRNEVEFGLEIGAAMYTQASADPDYEQVNVTWGYGVHSMFILPNPLSRGKFIEVGIGTYFVSFQTPDFTEIDPIGEIIDPNGPNPNDRFENGPYGTYAGLDKSLNFDRNGENGWLMTADATIPFAETAQFHVNFTYMMVGHTNPWSVTVGINVSFDKILGLLGLSETS